MNFRFWLRSSAIIAACSQVTTSHGAFGTSFWAGSKKEDNNRINQRAIAPIIASIQPASLLISVNSLRISISFM